MTSLYGPLPKKCPSLAVPKAPNDKYTLYRRESWGLPYSLGPWPPRSDLHPQLIITASPPRYSAFAEPGTLLGALYTLSFHLSAALQGIAIFLYMEEEEGHGHRYWLGDLSKVTQGRSGEVGLKPRLGLPLPAVAPYVH